MLNSFEQLDYNMEPTPAQLLEIYSNGFQGVRFSRSDYVALRYSTPRFYDIFPEAIGIGKGKLSLPYKAVVALEPEFGIYENQTTGDCQNGSSTVRMADGSIKQIKDIQIGEYVISGLGNKRKVIDVIKKEYSGKMIRLHIDGYPLTIESTPDHKYFVYSNIECNIHDDIDKEKLELLPISELKIGQYIHIPNCVDEKNCKLHIFDMVDFANTDVITDKTNFKKLRLEPVSNGMIRLKNGRNEIRRNVELDEKLAWLLGLYLAEGGIDGVNGNERITYNLGSHEGILAEQTKQYFKDIFGIEAKVYQVPSKPTVIYVRIYNKAIANLFKKLCPGDIYNKNISDIFFNCYRNVRLALIRGWVDGDGHISKDYCVSGTSVSRDLAVNMYNLSNSCNLGITYRTRKEYENHIEAYNIRFCGDSRIDVYPELSSYVKSVVKHKLLTKLGQAGKINKIEIVEPEDKYVYCIGVEIDHCFICNGINIKNCVSHSTRNAGMVDYCVDALFGETTYKGRFATENIYGWRGHGGQGADCSRLSMYVSQNGPGGFLPRAKYSSGNNSVDLSKYNSSIGHNWGRSGTPAWLNTIAAENKALQVYALKSVDEAIDALSLGFGISMCSGYGFSETRNEDGLAEQRGSWSHAMAHIGIDDTDWAHQKYGGPLSLIQNCYDDQTEVLTEDGWKLFKNLNKTEKLATLNPSNHNIEYHTPSEYQEYDYNGYMYKYNFRGVDLLVTPNHNIYVSKINKDTTDINSWELIEAQNAIGHWYFKKDGVWDGEEVQFKEIGNQIIPMDLWLEFLGYFISEGSTTHNVRKTKTVRADGSIRSGKSNHYIIQIACIKEKDVEKIQKLIDKFPIKFYKNKSGWRVNNRFLFAELRKLGKASQKYIPDYCKSLSSRQLTILYNALMVGDGSESIGKNGSIKRTYYTSSAKLADDFQELCLKIGYCADISTIDRIGRDNGSGGITRFKEHRVKIKICSKTPRNSKKGGLNPLLVPYNKKVYCCTVENHIIYVRRNGVACWCGQSWGKFNSGPKRHEQPDGSFWIRPKVLEAMIRGGGGWVIASVRGYNRQLVYDTHNKVLEISKD